MEIHKPKPWHGWREFLKEVGIIVIGVLIALGAEQAVEALQWHGKVAIVRKSILGELANDRARWELDVVEARCLSRDIDLLDRRAQEGGSAAAAPTPSGLLQTGRTLFWMHSASWNLATTSQTLDHFPIDQQLAFAALYDGITHRQVDIEKAADLNERVLALIPLSQDAQGRRELREVLRSLKEKLGSLIRNQAYMERHFDAVGVKPSRTDFAPDIAGSGCSS
jgi:hypothetical protein